MCYNNRGIKPALSIVVPTKNRYSTLLPVIKTIITHIEGSDYELVIQDNSDSNTDFLKTFDFQKSRQVKYYYEPGKLSVTENCNLAIANSTGKYVILIGDDDLVSPFIIQVVKLMEEREIDALIYTVANYYWKSLVFAKEYAFQKPASLVHLKNCTLDLQEVDAKTELNSVLAMGGIFLHNLPALYHGIVKRSVIEEVKKKFGAYVPGSSPDMAVAVGLACVLSKYYKINLPMSIAGASKSSAAGLGVKNAHVARIEDVPWLPADILKNWDERIPRIWTGYTIYAQSMKEVLKRAGNDQQLNHQSLYAKVIENNFSARRYVFPFLKNSGVISRTLFLTGSFSKVFLKNIFWKLPSGILNIIFSLKGDFKVKEVFFNVDTINDCMLQVKTKQSFLFDVSDKSTNRSK